MAMTRRNHTHCYQLKNSDKQYTCNGCKMPGFGERYTCNKCGDELHKECRFPKTTSSHEFFGHLTFKFLEEPFIRRDRKNRKEYAKVCDACGKDICGFSYHCAEDNLDLHPCCRNLERKLAINETIFELEKKVSSKCKRCEKKKISSSKSVPGWSYISRCGKYHFHVYCMTEMVHEAYMKHGSLGLEKMDLRHLVKFRRSRRERSIVVTTIKLFLEAILSVLFGNPSAFLVGVATEFLRQ